MSTTIDRLYGRLPAIVRLRDAERDGALRALMGVMEQQLLRMEQEVERRYDDLFIETCRDEIVPRIADLLGIEDLDVLQGTAAPGHAWVARTLEHRRGKGTKAVLEQLAADAANWPAHAVEYFLRLVVTTPLNHIREGFASSTELRGTDSLEHVRGPFDRVPRLVDVRNVSGGRGRHNLPSVGVHAWTHPVWPQSWTSARPMLGQSGRYHFDPLGLTRQLFSPGDHPVRDEQVPEERFPGALRRRSVYDELERARASTAAADPVTLRWFASDPGPVLSVRMVPTTEVATPGAVAPIPSEALVICNLDDWEEASFVAPAATRTYPGPGGDVVMPITAAVDPVRGRLLLLSTPPDLDHVELSWTLATPGRLGAGTQDGAFDPELDVPLEDRFARGVTRDAPGTERSASLVDALAVAAASWATGSASLAVITVLDSRSYPRPGEPTPPLVVEVPRGRHLVLRAAPGHRPHIQARLQVSAEAGAGLPGRLTLEGLLIEGGVELDPEAVVSLHLRHCTVQGESAGQAITVDGTGSAEAEEHTLVVELDACECGPLGYLLPVGEDPLAPAPTTVEWIVRDSVVDAEPQPVSDSPRTGTAIEVPGCVLSLERVTVLGGVVARTLHGTDSILAGDTWVQRTQIGCLRFSWLANAVQVPRRYKCQPGLALHEAAQGQGLEPWQVLHIEAETAPSWSSLRFDSPDYARLHPRCTPLVYRGAESGSSMGAHSGHAHPLRRARLESALTDATRFGMDTGVFFVAAKGHHES
ncbi:MAG: hypothetical protein K0V04_21455 [Deltaproteobacteria bacterium]|nr:hypothetical protein [Deltaproteobacteria bacterium]